MFFFTTEDTAYHRGICKLCVASVSSVVKWDMLGLFCFSCNGLIGSDGNHLVDIVDATSA